MIKILKFLYGFDQVIIVVQFGLEMRKEFLYLIFLLLNRKANTSGDKIVKI